MRLRLSPQTPKGAPGGEGVAYPQAMKGDNMYVVQLLYYYEDTELRGIFDLKTHALASAQGLHKAGDHFADEVRVLAVPKNQEYHWRDADIVWSSKEKR